MGETPNPQFEKQMRVHRLAWQRGTKEYAHRLSYPGKEAAEHVCYNNNCINYKDTPITTTYWQVGDGGGGAFNCHTV
jgi:hypothetical protein